MNCQSLLQLPIGPLNNILRRLSMAELKNACLASRGFYELITSNPSSIKRFILKVGPEFIHAGYRTLLEALLQSDRVFESMYIDVGLADTEALYNKNLLLEVVKKFGPQIKEITIKDFPANFKSHDVLNLLPNIVSATVIGCVMSLTQYSQKNLTLPFNNLKILKVENSAISSFNHTKTLQYISYKMQNNDVLNLIPLPVTTIFNEILSSNQATIKTLIVTGNVFNENNYSGLNLLHLSLNYPLLNQMVIKNMANFLSHQNELQHLSIALDFSIGADLVKVVMQMRQLKSLEINYPEIGDNFNHIYVNPNLDSLVLKNISDRGWSSYTDCSHFINSFPGIKQLDLQLGHPEDMEVGRLLTFAYARNFHHFRLQCDGVQSSVFHNFKWTELTELCIENCPSRNRVDWISVIINNPNVKSLSIGYYGNITNEDYKLMAINWKLEKIKIIDNENDSQLNLDLEGLRVILENCGYLKVLSVALKGKEEDYKELFTEFEEKIKQIDCEFIYNTTEYTLPYFDAWQSIEEDFLFNFP